MTDQAREAFEKRKSGQGYTHGELNTDPSGNYPYPGMQGEWVDFQFAYGAGLSAGREQAIKVAEYYALPSPTARSIIAGIRALGATQPEVK